MYKGNILVVDDINTNLELLEMIIDDAGYDVRTSKSGEMALKSIAAQKPDLILLDIMMPGISGYETCEIIKQDKHLKDIPIIFLSAKSEAQDKVKGFEVGAVDYLTKPFDATEVLARIKNHISAYFLKKELLQNLKIIDEYVITSSTDLNGYITKVSQAFCEISGYEKKELIGKKHDILRSVDIRDEVYVSLWKAIKSGKTWKGEIKNVKKNGDLYWVDAIVSPNKDQNGGFIGYTSIRHDITDKKRIEELAIRDQLTGLYNRRYFSEMFPLQIKQAIRRKSFLSFLMIDVDFFKQYNDTYGHQLGDVTLSNIAQALKNFLNRTEDLVFRLGGEEFSIVYNTDSRERSTFIAKNVCKSIEELKIEHKSSVASDVVTISIGVACIDFSKKSNYGYECDNLYKIADDELYKAKNSGRNRISVVSL